MLIESNIDFLDAKKAHALTFYHTVSGYIIENAKYYAKYGETTSHYLIPTGEKEYSDYDLNMVKNMFSENEDYLFSVDIQEIPENNLLCFTSTVSKKEEGSKSHKIYIDALKNVENRLKLKGTVSEIKNLIYTSTYFGYYITHMDCKLFGIIDEVELKVIINFLRSRGYIIVEDARYTHNLGHYTLEIKWT